MRYRWDANLEQIVKTLIKIDQRSEGLHPSQATVIFTTKDGVKEIILDRAFLSGSYFMSFFIRRDGDDVLIELPAETSDGRWRVTVDAGNTRSEQLAA